MKYKNKSGFVSMTLVYTFLIVFLFLMLAILQTYTEKNKYLEAIDEKINGDLNISQEKRSSLFNKVLTDNTPKLDSNIKYHNVSSASGGNGNGLYYSDDISKSDLNNDNSSGRLYYFRGDVNNNYVVLNNICFRIMRTNEDGNFRVRYAGEFQGGACPIVVDPITKVINPSVKISIGSVSYSDIINSKNSVGYIYGNVNLGDAAPKSNVKEILDNWYIEKMLGTELSLFITDTMFCNNRKEVKVEGGTTYFKAYELIPTIVDPDILSPYEDNKEIKNMTLNCEQKDDRFNLSEFSYGSDSTGNMLLNYPVGLVTMEDVVLSGGVYGVENKDYYMFTNSSYWTISPYSFDTTAKVMSVNSDGSLKERAVNEVLDVVPVISISSDAIVESGNGEYNKPYIIK